MMIDILIKGFLVSGSLIVAIGAQNAFVLKQGLLKQHVFAVALVCWLCDFVLISLGVLGLGALLAKHTFWAALLAICGSLFLLWYGSLAARRAWLGQGQIELNHKPVAPALRTTLLTTLAFTLLNPHVYLDTVVIIGGIAAPLSAAAKTHFLIGALLASAMWFFGLAYGARLLLPWFQQARTWRILDGLIAVVMFVLAAGLLTDAWRLLQASQLLPA